MRHFMGLIVAGGVMLGQVAESKAQFSLSMGNPYTGSGLSIGTPGGYSYGYPNYSSYGPGLTGYSSGFNSYSTSAYVAGPGNFSYNSGYSGLAPYNTGYAPSVGVVNGYGYSGYAPGVALARPYVYANRPYYGSYGYRNNGYGVRPFRGLGQLFR